MGSGPTKDPERITHLVNRIRTSLTERWALEALRELGWRAEMTQKERAGWELTRSTALARAQAAHLALDEISRMDDPIAMANRAREALR